MNHLYLAFEESNHGWVIAGLFKDEDKVKDFVAFGKQLDKQRKYSTIASG